MARQKRILPEDVTPALLKFREKRKWQIAFRRYVLEAQPCVPYAPYFGLDIKSLRDWFESQFTDGIVWDDFGKRWQFDHIIPVTYFDFAIEEDLKMCWNFTNIRVALLSSPNEQGDGIAILSARRYFKNLYDAAHYQPCQELLYKIEQLEKAQIPDSAKQQRFITDRITYLNMIENYSSFEFELLNAGRTIEEVIKEVNFLKKF